MLLAIGDGRRKRRLGFANIARLGLAGMYIHQSGIDHDVGLSERRLWSLPAALEHLKSFVADRSGHAGKSAVLNVSCPAVLVSQKTIDAVVPTLAQLLRNAVEHGVEAPVARLIAGKPLTATIELDVSLSADQIQISISDDGGGIDPAKVDSVRRCLGDVSERGLAAVTDEARRAAMLRCGIVLIGRHERTAGGLQRAVARIAGANGTIGFVSEAGHGTTFRLAIAAPTVMCEALSGVDDARAVRPHARAPH